MPSESSRSSPHFGSLLFWPILAIAAMLYACVALSPRMLKCLELQHEFHVSQVKLVKLERQVDILKRMAEALEHDPQLKGELARVDFDASRPGDERIPVEARLRFDRLDSPVEGSFSEPKLPWYSPFVRIFAEVDSLRNLTLAIAAVLVLLGFGFLNDSTESTDVICATGVANDPVLDEPEVYRQQQIVEVPVARNAVESGTPIPEELSRSVDRGTVNVANPLRDAPAGISRRSWISLLVHRYRATTPAK